MDIKRLTSALLGFPLVVIVLVFGNKYVVDIAFSIIAIMSLHEYFKGFRKTANPIEWVGYVAAGLISLTHVIPVNHALTIVSVLIPVAITVLFLHIILTNMKYNIKDVAITFFGICYIALFLMFIPLINGFENGNILVWYVLFAAWGTDIFAYLAGKTIGKHKFSKISPNKTVEGCIAGILGALVIILVYTFVINTFLGMNISYGYITGTGIILSIIGQIGDFAASSIKRYVEIKDFSNLIPGHGGMLDRIDSVIFIAPFAYMLLMLV